MNCLRRSAAGALALACALGALPASRARAQAQSADTLYRAPTAVVVRDPGPGRTGRMLRSVLAGPHVAILTDSTRTVHLRRDSSFATTVVVLGGDATVASSVQGDVIVVDGDLFLRPGASIEGRAVAIGGGVYNSTLAVVRGGQFSYREHTFDVVRTADGRVELSFRVIDAPRPSGPYLPLVYGFRIPGYDRVNGLSLPFGPVFPFDTARFEVEPVVTYRSHLGDFDPALIATANLDRRTEGWLRAERGTFTNDAWIRPDPANAIATFLSGGDSRNYFRADRFETRGSRRWEGVTATVEPFVGARTERAWSAGPTALSTSAPFSVTERRDRLDGMLRPNPRVRHGRISSLLGGATMEWEQQGVLTTVGAQVEGAVDAPGDARFAQLTFDGEVGFPTFGTHTFRFSTHTVLTAGDSTPPQRYAYLGGPGTLLTLDLLELGGDQLFFGESRYTVPLTRPEIPFLGAPVVTLRHLIGGAGVDGLGKLVQNVGVRVELAFVRADFVVDPATRETVFDVSFRLFRR